MRRYTIHALFFLSGAVSGGCSDGDAPEGVLVHAGSACSEAAAVSREDLLGGAPALCEHQTLVASLLAREDYAVPLRLVTDDVVEYCFDDDDGEAHRASIMSNGEAVVELTAGGGCVTRHLAAGLYDLRLTHELRAGEDSRPDVVHTRWSSSGPKRLLLTTNGCPGCDLREVRWPRLADFPNWGTFGFDGDYTGARFDRSFCRHPDDSTGTPRAIVCTLGHASPSSFDDAVFDETSFSKLAITVTFGDLSRSPATTFRNASFKGVRYQSGSLNRMLMTGDFTGAAWTGAVLPGATVRGIFRQTLPEGFGHAEISESTLDVPAYRAFQATTEKLSKNVIEVATSDDLSKLTLTQDNAFLWPLGADNAPTMAGMTFRDARLTGIVFPCVSAGDLGGTHWEGATLERVSFSRCDLGGARFDRAVLKDVLARDAALLNAVFSSVTIDGLDLSGASLDTVLSHASGTVARGLVLNDASGRLVANELAAEEAKFFHAKLVDSRFVNAKLSKADFGASTLERTDFTGATLNDAVFTNVVATGVVFDGTLLRAAVLDGARFTATTFDAAHLDDARFTAGRVCGGSARGVILNGAQLGGTVFPASSNRYTIAGETFDCTGIAERDTAASSAATTCPDARPGPCTQDPQWIPVGITPACCDPWDSSTWTGATCDKLRAGAPCSASCDCASLKCVAGKCG